MPFWTKYTSVVSRVPKFKPVMTRSDFKTGDDEDFERDVTCGVIDGL